jgi:FdhE protein
MTQTKNPALDPVADDVATVALDVLAAEEGFRRSGANPFLLGY